MEPHGNKHYAVGTDVGGSHVCSAVIDLRTGEMAGPVCEMPLDSKAGASAVLDVLSRSIAGAVEAAGAAGMVAGAGLAFPGPFDYVHGVSTVHGVGKYDRIYGLDLSSSLYSLLCGHGICSFRFVNDAAAFALGECAAGAAAGAARVVAVTLGTGVGSGFVEDGALVESGDRVPACGWVYHLPFGDGIADGEFSTRWICRRFFNLTGRKVAGAKDVADECAAGSRRARMLFEEYGSRFADFISPVLKRFGADMLVLGGNISRAYGLFGPALENGMARNGCSVRVRTSALLDRAAMTGAASLFRAGD